MKPLAVPAFGPDMSNYGGALSAQVVDCWRASGQSFVIPGTQIRSRTRQQLAICRDRGMPRLEAYGFTRWELDPKAQMAAWLETIAPHPVRRLWIDAEEEPGVLTPPSGEVREILIKISEAAGDFPIGIYTGYYWWREHTANWTGMSHLPLWHASQFASLVPTASMFPPYGGWTAAHTWQYRGTGPLCGYSVDQNIRFLDDEDDPQEDEMIRFNAVSDWYEKPEHQIFDGTRGINARLDFGIPAEAVAVELEISVHAISGTVHAYDGDEAGNADPPGRAFDVERPALYFAGRANLSADGWCHMRADGTANLRRVSIVGYYLH